MDQILDKFNKSPLPVKVGGILAVIAVMTAVNYFVVIDPIEAQIQDRIGQIHRLDQTLTEKSDIAQNLTERRKELDQLEQQLQEALSELPERKDIDELLAQLNDIGRKAGLEISSLEPKAESPQGFFARIPISMSVSGNYHEIAMFLQEVSNLRRIVNVAGINLVPQSGSPADKVILRSTFTATTFRFLDQGSKADKAKKPGGE